MLFLDTCTAEAASGGQFSVNETVTFTIYPDNFEAISDSTSDSGSISTRGTISYSGSEFFH